MFLPICHLVDNKMINSAKYNGEKGRKMWMQRNTSLTFVFFLRVGETYLNSLSFSWIIFTI